jgi:hypothetical protein
MADNQPKKNLVTDHMPDLLPGETELGQYEVAIARCTTSGWTATIPPLKATITNYRLMLQPQTRRPYTPASIPSTYITRVSDVLLGSRAGVRVSLKTGQDLYMYISMRQGGKFTEALTIMLTSPVGSAFKHHPAQRDLRRLIQFIRQL